MKIIYKIIKYGLIIFILLITIPGIIIKYSDFQEKENLNIPYFNFSYKIIEGFETFFINDNYKKNILTKVEMFKEEFSKLLTKKIEKFNSIKNDKNFIDAIFMFTVTKNTKSLINYFSTFTDFKDIIIIDKNNNLIYKIKDFPFPLSYTKISKEFEIKNFNKEIVISQNYFDNTLDISLQISGIIDNSEIKNFIKNSPFLMAYILDENIIKNDKFPQIWLQNINPKEEINIYKGIYNLKISPLYIDTIYIGSIAISYPVRDLGSILIFILKLLMVIIILLSLYELDKFIENRLTGLDITKKQRLQQKKLKKSKEIPEEMEKEYEKSLNWVEKYIEKTEEKK
ncbi:MAG: hypothetical protein N2258_01040 [Brevinematales bacterium]|nr:hypothetical protein [Brevinematales bacterium]